MSNFSAFLNGAGQLVTNDGDDFYAAMVSGRISLQLTLANGNYNGTATTSAAFSADFSADPDFNNEARDEIPNLDLASRTVVEPVAAAAGPDRQLYRAHWRKARAGDRHAQSQLRYQRNLDRPDPALARHCQLADELWSRYSCIGHIQSRRHDRSGNHPH